MPTRRRSEPDPLAPSAEPTWLVVQGPFREVLSSVPLPPHADLRKALNDARAAHLAQGWGAEPIGPRCSFFFCERDGERRMVLIARVDPAKPVPMR